MNFDKRSFGIALLWLAILALAIVWLYGVVHRHDLAGVTGEPPDLILEA